MNTNMKIITIISALLLLFCTSCNKTEQSIAERHEVIEKELVGLRNIVTDIKSSVSDLTTLVSNNREVLKIITKNQKFHYEIFVVIKSKLDRLDSKVARSAPFMKELYKKRREDIKKAREKDRKEREKK